MPAFPRPLDLNAFPPGHTIETVEEITGHTGSKEWWRPQVHVVDPGKVYDGPEKKADHFAPIGPSPYPTEVSPFREMKMMKAPVQIGDEDDDLKDIFMLGSVRKKSSDTKQFSFEVPRHCWKMNKKPSEMQNLNVFRYCTTSMGPNYTRDFWRCCLRVSTDKSCEVLCIPLDP